MANQAAVQFRCTLWLALLLTSSFGMAQQASTASPLPLAPNARVVRINPQPGFFNEPSLAVNATNPRQLVAAFQVNAAVAYSEDGGQSWTIAQGTAPPDYKRSGDVSITYDNRGRAFLCYIAFDKLGTMNYWAHGATRNGIFVRRSPDGGRTWESTPVAVIAHQSDPGIPFEDKPYIVADTTHSRYAGNLYVGWTEFSLLKSVILFSRSTDGGMTWSPPIEISSHEGLPRDETGSVEGFIGAVGSDGTLYVVWADGSEIVFSSSRDGGRTFSRSHRILKTAPSYFEVANVSRANGFPEIGVDPRSNRLFVVWADYRNGDIDVFSSVSTDKGKRWSPAVRVNADSLHNGADQFMQWLAVDPLDGSANVIFYDRRADPENRKIIVALARSTDAGRSFTNYAWDLDPFDPEEEFIGDYTGAAALGGKVYGAWARTPPAEEKTESAEREETKRKVLMFVEIGIADFSGSIH
ncbi:MAG: hypothetical protein JO249_02500 [Acidobacteria bacterium]|nr:hypothetical protein [Acidobacteriota bacterium]